MAYLSKWSLGIGLLAYGALLYLLAPAEINGDGIGYLKQIQSDSLVPGHLAFLPLLRALASIWPHQTLLDLVAPFRLLSLSCGLGAVVLVLDASRRIHPAPNAALFSAALFGLSCAFVRAATQVEVYGPATLAAVATLWALLRFQRSTTLPRQLAWAAASGGLAGLAVLFHLTLSLLVVPLALLLSRGSRGRLAAPMGLGCMAVMVLVPMAITLDHQGISTLQEAWTWIRSSDHGIADPHGWSAPLVAAWGISRSLVHVPYPHESPLPLVIGLTVVAAAAWLVLLLLARRRVAVDGWMLWGWALPLTAFAVVFFPSDTERWVFVLPVVALTLGPLAGSGRRLLPGLLLMMALVNLGLGLLPAALDHSSLQRAAAAERLAKGNALVISPGHGWTELVGLGSHQPPSRFPLIYHVGAEGSIDDAVSLMHQRVTETLSSGGRVFVARLGDQNDKRGYKELAWFGLTRQGFARLFDRYRLHPTGVEGLREVTLGSREGADGRR